MLGTLLLAGFVLLIIYWYLIKPKNLPPGPSGIPLLGSLPMFLKYGDKRHHYFRKLTEKYGNVVCLRLAFGYMIVLGDMNAVRQAFVVNGNAFGGRGLQIATRFSTYGKGILTAEGQNQRNHRRFILHALRDMGFGRVSIESHVHENIAHVFKTLMKNQNKPLDVTHLLGESVMAIIIKTFFGVDASKEEINFILTQLDKIAEIPASALVVNSSSLLLSLCEWEPFRNFIGAGRFRDVRLPMQIMIKKMILEQKEQFKDSDNPTNFIQTYILEQRKHEKEDDAFWWDDDQLMHACVELLVAGTETTKQTISWAFLLLASHPNIQEKVFDEIVRVIGTERQISIRDQQNLPLCDATILEVLRFSSLTPTGVPHSTMEDTKLFDYFIPKDSFVMPNLYAIAYEESVFKNPTKFDPMEHFLDSTGNNVVNREQVIPFSVGRRSCVGESLARMEVFLYILTVVQKFRISLPPGVKVTDFAEEIIFRTPSIHTFVFTPR